MSLQIIISIVSSKQTFVNKEKMSKLAMKILPVSRLRLRNSSKEEKASEIMKGLTEMSRKRETRYLDR